MSTCFPQNGTVNSDPAQKSVLAFGRFSALAIRGLAVCCAFAALFVALKAALPRNEPPQILTVAKSPFKVETKTVGSLSPLSSTRKISECQWTVRILSLVPEGTWVQKGDIVCVLDSSEIEEFLRSREVSLIKAEASLQASHQQAELLKAANERRLSEAEHDLLAAEMDQAEYLHGSFPNEMRQLNDDISINRDRLQSAAENFEFAERMWMMGYASRPEVASESFKVTTQAESVRRLEFQRNLLQEFTHPRRDIEKKHQLNNSRLRVVRTELANSLAIARAKLGTLSDERRHAIYERYVKAAKASIEACVMRAPRDGQVMHSNNWNLQSRGIRTIEEGKSVYFSQPVFEIPDHEHLKIRLPLNESLITRVSVGSSLILRPTGYESLEVDAEISRISPYPVVRDRYAPELKEYMLDAVLKPLPSQQEFLHPRMEAEATVTLMEKADAISIPQEAVARCMGYSVVLMKTGDQFLACQVKPGEVVDGKVLIESGLQEGDQIIAALSEQQRRALKEKVGGSFDAGE